MTQLYVFFNESGSFRHISEPMGIKYVFICAIYLPVCVYV